MPEFIDETRFRKLLGQLLDGDLGEADTRELVAAVKSAPAYSAELRAQLFMDSRLSLFENELRSEEAFTQAIEAALDAEESGDDFVDKVVRFADAADSPARAPSRTPWLVAAVSIAACVALVLFWMPRMSTSPDENVDPGVAVVSGLVGELTTDRPGTKTGDTVSPGILELADGYLSLEFFRGAQVSVAGPARLELIDAQRIICHYGKVRAYVPPVARGFTIVTPESEVVDLGTEFAIEVAEEGRTDIHVFDGEVEAYDTDRSPESKKLLTAGLGVSISGGDPWKTMPAEQARFEDLADLGQLEIDAGEARFTRWQENHRLAQEDSRLIAYYDFEHGDDRKSRTLANRALTGNALDGAVVGARWVRGPWPGKRALSFQRPSDRVRVHLPGDYESITLAAWIRIDGMDRIHSSLLLTDGFESGEVHWQFRQEGHLVLGYRHNARKGQNYSSEEFMDLTKLGRWFHLASVIDHHENTVSHYLDGELLTTLPIKGELGTIRFGDAAIGNWDQPLGATESSIRNLNGRIAELSLYGVALSPAEIERLALK